MRSLLFILFLTTLCGSKAQQVLVLEGKYTGENLYFQNPSVSADVFCADSIMVNEEKVVSELNSSAFELRLNDMGFKPYDSLEIKVYHKAGCAPKALPSFIHHRSYVRIPFIAFDSTGMLQWTINNDSLLSKAVFIVEQYKWNKWVKAGEVEQADIKETHFNFRPVLHSGENRFRIKYTDHWDQPYLSGSAKMTSTIPPVTYNVRKTEGKIVFSSKTQYEVYDSSGNMISRGYEAEVIFPKKTKCVYFLHYDNRTAEIGFN